MSRPFPAAAARALLAAAPAGAASPGTADVLPFRAVERTLPNGLRVIAVPTGLRDLVSVQIAILLLDLHFGETSDLEEDRRIGAAKLGIRPDAVHVTKVTEVFAR